VDNIRKSITVSIASVLVFWLSAVSIAAEKTADSAEKHAASTEAVKKINGHIGIIDMKAGTMTVKGKWGETTVLVDDGTKIIEGQSIKSLEDLKSGEKVRVNYEIVDGKNIARKINVLKVVSSQPSAPGENRAGEKSAVPVKTTR